MQYCNNSYGNLVLCEHSIRIAVYILSIFLRLRNSLIQSCPIKGKVCVTLNFIIDWTSSQSIWEHKLSLNYSLIKLDCHNI